MKTFKFQTSVAILAALMITGTGYAAGDDWQTREYSSYIQQAWAHEHLRDDRVTWMAQSSVEAHNMCLIGGGLPDYCLSLVQDGLRELIGSEPAVRMVQLGQHKL